MNRSESIGKIASALAKAQTAMKNPGLDKENPHFKSKFASLAAVRDAVAPALAAQGIAVVQALTATEHGITCETMLMHGESGEWISDSLEVPTAKDDAQGYGSAATYARRYSLQAMCCIVGDDDDDANAATATGAKKKREPQTEEEETLGAFEFAIIKGETTGQYGQPIEYWQRFRRAIADGTAMRSLKKTKNGKELPFITIPNAAPAGAAPAESSPKGSQPEPAGAAPSTARTEHQEADMELVFLEAANIAELTDAFNKLSADQRRPGTKLFAAFKRRRDALMGPRANADVEDVLT